MKKRMLLLLWAALLICTGCSAFGEGDTGTDRVYELYFRVTDLESAAGEDAVATQKTTISLDTEMNATELAKTLLEALVAGPAEMGLRSPFPQGTEVQSLRIYGGRAMVDMSAFYGLLSGIDLALADYCITLTLTQIPEIRNVGITVDNQLLAYRSQQNLTARDVLMSSTDDVVATIEAKLYFYSADGQLVEEARKLELYEGDTRAESLVAALSEGPENKELLPAFPEGFAVQSIWVRDGSCYVNLSSVMLAGLPEGTDITFPLHSMIRSLLSLENLEEVELMLDGEILGVVDGEEAGYPLSTG